MSATTQSINQNLFSGREKGN